MGQRLNLEIYDGNYKSPMMGRVVANAYYHWSGYSESAVEILQEALKAIKEIKDEDPLVRAVKVLEATGASLTKEELERGKDILKGYESTSDIVSRNDGLIAVSAEGMKETRDWEEGRVEIHLNPYMSEDYVVYEVFNREDLAEERREAQSYGEEDYSKSYKHVEFNFKRIPFDRVDELEEIVTNNDGVLITQSLGFIK